MNRIIRRHYPVDQLPHDLRAGLPEGSHVTVTVEEEQSRRAKDTLDAWQRRAAELGPSRGDPLRELQELRDEWDRT